MVSQDEELPPLQKMMEVTDCFVDGQQLPVESTVLPLGRVQPLTEEGNRRQGAGYLLL